MDITVLAYLEPDDKEPDVAVRQVAAGLAKSGHKTSILTIRHDVNELIEGLKARKPQLVFNLVESFGDDIMGGVIGVAGVLDLLQIPYTGGGPGEIFLQEDKALTKKLLAFEGIRYPDFATFRGAIDDCLSRIQTDHREALAALMTLKFQTFDNPSLLAA